MKRKKSRRAKAVQPSAQEVRRVATKRFIETMREMNPDPVLAERLDQMERDLKREGHGALAG